MFEERYCEEGQGKDREFILIEEDRLKEDISESRYEVFDRIY